jgi:branched-chain amino acid transport system ATP-binding protein
MMLLKVDQINTFYGHSHIIFGVSLEVEEGETVCILGRNGVGKTTTLRSIMGLTPPRSGTITLYGEEIQGKQPFEIARRGIGFVYEDRFIFPDLTVRENLEIAIRPGTKDQHWTVEKAYTLFPVLRERNSQEGGTLSGGEQQMLVSGGEQQMLAIVRTLMGNPQLLLLDEPSEGLAPLLVRAIEEQIQLLKKQGVTILLSEQNLSCALSISDRAYILEKGHVCWNGAVSELKASPEVIRQYLGV